MSRIRKIVVGFLFVGIFIVMMGCGNKENREAENEIFHHEKLADFVSSLSLREIEEEEANAVMEAYFQEREEDIIAFENAETEISRGAAIPSPEKNFSNLLLKSAYTDEEDNLYIMISEIYDSPEREKQLEYDSLVEYMYEEGAVTIISVDSLE